MKFVRSFGIPILESIATLSLAVLSLVLSVWIRSASKTDETDAEPPSVLSLLAENVTNFDTPVPYFAIALVVALVGRIDAFRNRYKLGELDEVEAKLQTANDENRAETQAHADSKSSYLETLGSALKYLLTSNGTGFDYRCRVTIYRRQKDDDNYLGQIFRHSPTFIYEQNGRIRVPIDEGVVGAAWRNHGVKEFERDLEPNSDKFTQEMENALKIEGCKPPDVELSMPSKHFYARSFTDHETGRQIGIVVYESTETGVLDRAGIDKVLANEALGVSRLIRHLGVLHSEFYPDPGEE